MDLKEVGYEDVEWIDLFQKTDQWHVVMITAMKVYVSWNEDTFWTVCAIINLPGVLWSMELLYWVHHIDHDVLAVKNALLLLRKK
jgi:hypothetical protein